MDKRSLSERDICTKFITPALRRSGWEEMRQIREECDRAWKVSAEEIKDRGYNLDIKNPHTAGEDLGDPEALLEELTSAEAEVASVRDELKGVLAEALLR